MCWLCLLVGRPARMHAALLNRVPDNKAEETVTTLMVVGAGAYSLHMVQLSAAIAALTSDGNGSR